MRAATPELRGEFLAAYGSDQQFAAFVAVEVGGIEAQDRVRQGELKAAQFLPACAADSTDLNPVLQGHGNFAGTIAVEVSGHKTARLAGEFVSNREQGGRRYARFLLYGRSE